VNYNTFYTVFLTEMPWKIPGSNDFAAQLEMLQEMISYGDQIDNVAPNIFKIVNGNQTTYWHGSSDATVVTIIVDTNSEGNFCKVVLTSKNPSANSLAPYASDLYMAIKHDIQSSNLVFASDAMMTDDVIKLWKRIAASGQKLSVFNTSTNQYELSPVNSATDLDKFVGGIASQKYIFVLSESHNYYAGVKHAVDLMELKRKAGYPLQEMFTRMKNNVSK